MSPARRVSLGMLLVLAAGTSFWAWQIRKSDAPPPLVGPPRSDYQLFDFDLIALDAEGKESFAASGPRLTRHPNVGSLDIEQPRFSSPDSKGKIWTSTAARAWVNEEGTELRLLGAAEVRGPVSSEQGPILLRSEALTVFPREQRVLSEVAVTVTEPGSILTAVGMRANLDAQQVELLSDVRIRHEAPRANAR